MLNRSCTKPFLFGTLVFILITASGSWAQDDDIFGIDRKLRGSSRKSESDLGNVFRNAIGSFSFEAAVGSGLHSTALTFHSQSPSEYGNITSVLTDNSPDISADDTLTFRGTQFAQFAQLGVKLNIFDLLIIGGGYGREWGRMDPLKIEDYRFGFENPNYTFDKLFGTVGIVLFDANKRASFLNWRYKKYDSNNFYMQTERRLRIQQEYLWRFVLDGEFGKLISRGNFDSQVSIDEPYYGVGFRIERDLSEYTHIYIRPAVSIRNFNYGRADLMESQAMTQTMATIQVGASLRIPSTKRCKVPGCGVVMKHIHNGVEYRGSSIWKRQHRKVGQWYGN
ncbi:hypothetical protein [Lunatibacter salilacus]|uniref:hypothetical protein n=1 Tax=Lunatibacter salilacus TaxID=2483804 RepID=UPI001F33D2A9|nr:hypothetical protein [Lunatibacter salilacus]